LEVDLLSLARDAGSRRGEYLIQPTEPTRSQSQDLQRILILAALLWRDGYRSSVIPAYRAALISGSLRSVVSAVDLVYSGSSSVLGSISSGVREWASSLQSRHMRMFISRVRSLTRVDLTSRISSADVESVIDDFTLYVTSLADDVSGDTRSAIIGVVSRGLQSGASTDDVAAEIAAIIGVSLSRARRIAVDQTAKLTAALDRARQTQVGADSFIWVHSRKERFRPHHKARDGQEFRWDSQVARTDPPGHAPFCGCSARGVLRDGE